MADVLIRSMKPNLTRNMIIGGLLSAFTIASPILLVSQAATAANTDVATSQNSQANNLVAAKRLNKLLANTKSMTANFTQTTKGAGSNSGLSGGNGTFLGTMSVQRPNNFRWHTTSPAEQLIIANGSNLWIYDKDLEQATKQSVDAQVGNTPALLFSGDPSTIDKSFKITQPHGNKNYYVLYPKSDDANFKSLAISFNSGKPVMMVLNDSLGQTTSINFSNIKINPSIKASQFQFVVPDGVDVINQ